MRTPSKIAIFGGSFDPPHLAHTEIAKRALDQFGFDKVLLVVAGNPYQKHTHASPEQRYEMTRLAAEGIDGLEVSRIELDRPGPSYTIDTVEELLACNPGSEIWVIVGSDALEGIKTWHRWRDLLAKAKFCVVPRPGHPLDRALSTIADEGAEWVVVDLPALLEYSSTEIRKALREGMAPEGLPDSVASYIEKHGLYRSGAQSGG